MSTYNNRLEQNELLPSIQRAQYHAGYIKLNEQFEPWAEYLQKAIQTAALYGIPITEAEAEAAIACLFEINPQSC